MKRYIWAPLLLVAMTLQGQKTVDLLPGELWWGGQVNDSEFMPFGEDYKADLTIPTDGQAQPLLISNKGRYIWNDKPFSVHLYERTLILDGATGFDIGQSGNNLSDVYTYATENFMDFSNATPDPVVHQLPIYPLSDLTRLSQSSIQSYAKSILDDGFPAGILKIGNGWQMGQGDWRFDPDLFPDPKAMIQELHDSGFKIMVWVSPFISPDSKAFLKAMKSDDGCLKNAFDPESCKIVSWEGGYSAILDLTKPSVKVAFQQTLKTLQKEIGVDGFIFGGSSSHYYEGTTSDGAMSAQEQAQAIVKVGQKFKLNEFSEAWKMGGYPITHAGHGELKWSSLKSMINHIAVQGIMGYPYSSWAMHVDKKNSPSDSTFQELVVRTMQAQALLPIMTIPYTVIQSLDDPYKDACKRAVQLHQEQRKLFLSLSGQTASSGSPMVQLMDYAYPESVEELRSQQYTLGSDMIIAPILEYNQKRKKIHLPEGTWISHDGRGYEGPQIVNIMVDLETIPFFRKVEERQ